MYSASWMVSRALSLLATVLATCLSTGVTANSGVDGPDPAESSVLAPHAVGGVILERHLAQAAKPPGLEVLTYDCRRDRKGVYASVRAQGLALRVGKLKGSGPRPYHSSDKPTWLLQTLPTRTSNVVMMVDASDMHLLCGADELLAKRRVLTGGDDNTVVVGGSHRPHDLHPPPPPC